MNIITKYKTIANNSRKYINSTKAIGCIITLFWVHFIIIMMYDLYSAGLDISIIGGILIIILSLFGVRTGIVIFNEKKQCAFSIFFLSFVLTLLSVLVFLTARDYLSQMWPMWMVALLIVGVHWVSLYLNLRRFKNNQ